MPTPAGCLSVSVSLQANVPGTLTYGACGKDVARHECLALRHRLDQVWNREDEIIGRSVLSQLSIDMCLNSQHFVEFGGGHSNWSLLACMST